MDLEERLQLVTGATPDASRVLVTLLFTDLVGSTERVAEMGDRRWRELLGRHHRTVRALLERFGGHEVDCAGDGFFATFGTASQAVGCGFSLTMSLASLGLDARVGLHTGECERFGPKVSGVAVHAAARVVQLARPREVLVTETVRSVVAGSGLAFEGRGTHVLKGLPGEWALHAAIWADPDEPGMRTERHGQRVHAPRRRRSPVGPKATVGPRKGAR